MLKQAGHQLLFGLTVSALLAINPVMADSDSARPYLIDSQGNPVLSPSGKCIVTPNQPYSKGYVQCGDGSNDADGDGVSDDKDKCPDTPKGVKVDEKGCPIDTDGDGVPDYRDKCPNNTAVELGSGVDANGCPKDSDGDGVPDYRDKCPNTPANTAVDANGCAVVTAEYDTVLDSDSGKVKFGFDKANLTASGKGVLDGLVEFVNGDIVHVQSVEVIGHTDSAGPSNYNLKLSKRRAQAVANYLISQGMPSNKVIVTGKGESQPAQSNATRIGRAQNRRVVITTRKTNKVRK